MTDTELINGLRQLCGYIEAGEGVSVTIGQDDATKEWTIYWGTKWTYGSSLRLAIEKAILEERNTHD